MSNPQSKKDSNCQAVIIPHNAISNIQEFVREYPTYLIEKQLNEGLTCLITSPFFDDWNDNQRVEYVTTIRRLNGHHIIIFRH